MAPLTFQLVMRTGPTPGKAFDLSRNEMTIGRDIANDIVISDPEISRKHARLTATVGSYQIEDSGSTNGTYVNGQRLIGPHLLRAGELVLLGENVSLVYEILQFDPDATLAAGAPVVPSMPPATPSPAREAYVPPLQPERPAPAPVYSGQIPAGPDEDYLPGEDERKNPSRTWLIAGCGCLLVILCVLVVAAFAFDTLNLYCTPPFNSLFPCPP